MTKLQLKTYFHFKKGTGSMPAQKWVTAEDYDKAVWLAKEAIEWNWIDYEEMSPEDRVCLENMNKLKEQIEEL